MAAAPRIHLVTHPEAPIAVVLRRGPTRIWHVMSWHLDRSAVKAGSWFRGRIYPYRSGLSLDGGWLVYFAMGADGEIWTGLCKPPYLRTALHWPHTHFGTWNGGGVFTSSRELRVNQYEDVEAEPGKLQAQPLPSAQLGLMGGRGEDEGVLYERLRLGGWKRAGPFGEEEDVSTPGVYRVRVVDDPGWRSKEPGGIELAMYVRGYNVLGRSGRVYHFDLPGYPGCLDADVEWADWDRDGRLLVARRGGLERWSARDIERGAPSFRHDLTDLEHPFG